MAGESMKPSKLRARLEPTWLSRGKDPNRIRDLQDQIQTFLREKDNDLTNAFGGPIFTVRPAYFNELFTHMNDLNVRLQEGGVTIVEAIVWGATQYSF